MIFRPGRKKIESLSSGIKELDDILLSVHAGEFHIA
jgi:hypothetical protein